MGILLHEMAHALSAKAFGLFVLRVTLGWKKLKFKTRWLGVDILFSSFREGGLTIFAPQTKNKLRLKMMFVILIAPAVNLAIAGAAAAGIQWAKISPLHLDKSLFLFSILLPQAIILLGALYPFPRKLEGNVFWPDIPNTFRWMFMKQAAIEKALESQWLLQGIRAFEERNLASSLAHFERYLPSEPKNENALLTTMFLQTLLGRPKEALATWQNLAPLVPEIKIATLRSQAWNLTACLLLYLQPENHAENAETNARLACEANKSDATESTLGASKIAGGKYEEGISLLISLVEKKRSPAEELWDRSFLHLAYRKAGPEVAFESNRKRILELWKPDLLLEGLDRMMIEKNLEDLIRENK